jgi:uncharacterized membrane protein YphA (DoxX/SURF4 family)
MLVGRAVLTMLPTPQTYARWLAVVRIFTGIFWLLHGIPKLVNPKFFGPDGMMAGMIREGLSGTSGPYHDFLVNVVLPNAGLFSHLVAWGETLTGLSLLLGLFTRLGGLGGVFLNLNYFMMAGSYAHLGGYASMDTAVMARSFMNIGVPTGRVWGLDGVLPVSRARR